MRRDADRPIAALPGRDAWQGLFGHFVLFSSIDAKSYFCVV
jgi:hypothetical protein